MAWAGVDVGPLKIKERPKTDFVAVMLGPLLAQSRVNRTPQVDYGQPSDTVTERR